MPLVPTTPPLVLCFLTILCLPYRLSLGLSTLLCHHPLHAQTLLILVYMVDSVHDSYYY
jgi:hypothetical protein